MYSHCGIDCYDSNSKISGLTYGAWTVLWWRWALSIASVQNPLLDPLGGMAPHNQRNDTWFIAGTLVEEESVTERPSRRCEIPLGKSILIPVINFEVDSMYYPDLKTDVAIEDRAEAEMEEIVKKECYINGVFVPCQRIRSDPIVFDIYIHADFDRVHRGGYARAASEGYWTFLKPLPKGEYKIRFEGACKNGRISNGANYNIEIV